MSGGSFDYLYGKDLTVGSALYELNQMIKSMKVDDFFEVASFLEVITQYLYKAEFLFSSMRAVMKEYEWWKSSDASKEDFQKVAKAFLESITNKDPKELRQAIVLEKELAEIEFLLKEKKAKIINLLMQKG